MDSKGKAHELSYVEWFSKLAFLVDMIEKLNYLNALLPAKGKLVHNLFGEVKAFQAKLKLWQRQLHQNVLDHVPCLQSALGDGKSGAKYADEIVKLQCEFNRWFQDFRKLENDIKMFNAFDIDVKAVPTDDQMEYIELQDDLDLKANFLSKAFLEFYKVSTKNNISKDFKTCSKIDLLGSTHRCKQFFSKMKYCKSKCWNRISNEPLHDTLCITASSMEPNITTTVEFV